MSNDEQLTMPYVRFRLFDIKAEKFVSGYSVTNITPPGTQWEWT